MANIILNYYNGESFIELYPKTLGELVEGAVPYANKLQYPTYNYVDLEHTTNWGGNQGFYGNMSVGFPVKGILSIENGGTGQNNFKDFYSYMTTNYSLQSGKTGYFRGTQNNAIPIKINTINGRNYFNFVFIYSDDELEEAFFISRSNKTICYAFLNTIGSATTVLTRYALPTTETAQTLTITSNSHCLMRNTIYYYVGFC